MNPPIILTAFGTTTRAMRTYSLIDAAVKAAFPDCMVKWAYTSRMVRAHMKKRRNVDMKDLHQVLDELHGRGHPWAVVQSLHLVCGHEFYRLVSEADHPAVRTSIGMPLMCSVEDYYAMVNALAPLVEKNADEALVFVGHGTDHPAWCSYTALLHMLKERFGSKVHVGVVEEGYPECGTVVRAVSHAGYLRVRLVPLMLVAGVHFEEDLAGEEASWKSAFEAVGIVVGLEGQGLGYNPRIVARFCRHIEAALDVIPTADLSGIPRSRPEKVI